jgi:hypothetical protein
MVVLQDNEVEQLLSLCQGVVMALKSAEARKAAVRCMHLQSGTQSDVPVHSTCGGVTHHFTMASRRSGGSETWYDADVHATIGKNHGG